MGRKDKWPSAILNNLTFRHYRNMLKNLAINRFEWNGLPDTCDPRWLELKLYDQGYCLFFKDEFLDRYLTLQATLSGPFTLYDIPIHRQAYSNQNYRYNCDDTNSVIIYENYLHNTIISTTDMYAYKLYEMERSIDVNIKSQKFPVIIRTDEPQRLTMQNLMMEYDGNVPFIFADKSLNIDGIEVFNLNPPYVADKIRQLKQQYINEYLTFIGVENSNNEKKERMVSDEVNSNYGSIEAFRNVGLKSRQQACEEINRMFGLNVSVKYSSVLPTMVNSAMNDIGSVYAYDTFSNNDKEEGDDYE